MAQLLHGLRIDGDLTIPGAHSVPGEGADLTVALGPARPVPASPPPGRLVASLERPGVSYAAAVEGERLTVRFPGAAEFRVGLETGAVEAVPEPGADEELVALLLAGNVLALILGLRGAVTLHAGVVELEGGGLAVAGPSGAGKTTVAALACAGGARLVGDDMARLEEDEAGFLAHRGQAELRLRPQAASLAGRLGGGRETPDGRIAVAAEPAQEELTPLRAIVSVQWADGADEGAPSAQPLSRRAALELQLASARVGGWKVPEPLRVGFDAAARLTERLPAFALRVPSEGLDDPALPASLNETLEPLVRGE